MCFKVVIIVQFRMQYFRRKPKNLFSGRIGAIFCMLSRRAGLSVTGCWAFLLLSVSFSVFGSQAQSRSSKTLEKKGKVMGCDG